MYLIHVQTVSQHFQTDTLMNSAKHFENQQSGTFTEIIQASSKEEIIIQHLFTFTQFRLSSFEIKVDVETGEEFSNWITVVDPFLKVINY
jgi:hypothetical protein